MKTTTTKKIKWLALWMLLSAPMGAVAQEGVVSDTTVADALCGYLPCAVNTYQTRQRSLVVGMGQSKMLDTYLSPLEYEGADLSVQRETFRMTRMAGGRIASQSFMRINLGFFDNEAETGSELSALASYSQGWLYQMRPLDCLNVYVGGFAEGTVGGAYNTRGSNNPAQARLYANLTASAMATYKARLWRVPVEMRYQVFAPILGVMFSPQYGQSYYEIFSLGQSDGVVHVTTPVTQPTMRHLLTFDVPLNRKAQLRFGYQGIYEQSKLSGLKTHTYTSSFVIGYVRTFTLIPSKSSWSRF